MITKPIFVQEEKDRNLNKAIRHLKSFEALKLL